jgi:hypothetical protein
MQPHADNCDGFLPFSTIRTLTDSLVYMMRIILVIPAAGLLLSSTLLPTNISDTEPLPGASMVSPIPPVSDKSPVMWSEATCFHLGEQIVLHFSTPHPPYLGVVNPDGKFFYVVFPAAQSVGALAPLVDSDKFVGLNRLVVQTSTLKADPYVHGITENQQVFTKSGNYTFLLGDNLHVDDPSLLTKLKVQYRHTAKVQPKTEVLP